MIGPFEMVLGIVTIGCAAGVIKHYLRVREAEQRENPMYGTKLDELEQRVRTLETIVTDRGYDLEREFDKL